MNYHVSKVLQEMEDNCTLLPSVCLLVAVLNRAIRDLDEPERGIRKEAVKWFSKKDKGGLPCGISFNDILENYFIPQDIVTLIDKRIAAAIVRLEEEAQELRRKTKHVKKVVTPC